MRTLALTVVTVAVMFVASCGGVSSTDDVDASVTPTPDAMVPPDAMPPDPCTLDEIPAADFGECQLRAICAFVSTCQRSATSAEECRLLIERDPLTFSIELQQAAINADKTDLDGALAKDCFDKFEECTLFAESCSRMLVGQTPQNGDCVNDIECGIGGNCLIAAPIDECKIGLCEIPLREGQSCEGGLACEAGLRCLGPVGALICSAGEVGDFCTTDFHCGDSNRCNEAAMVCEPRVAENAACVTGSDCVLPLECVGTVCSKPNEIGDACNNNCFGQLICRANVCAAAPQIGEACPENQCGNTFTADCVGGVCVAKGKVGESCAAVICEFGLTCEPGAQVCRAKTANGETCVNDFECAEFTCGAANVCEEFETCY